MVSYKRETIRSGNNIRVGARYSDLLARQYFDNLGYHSRSAFMVLCYLLHNLLLARKSIGTSDY